MTLKEDYKENLSNYFYNLAATGGGDSARGRYFYMLYALDVAYQLDLENYRPNAKPERWLALLFDIVTNYGHSYQGSVQEIKALIQQSLEQPFMTFLTQMTSLDLGVVAAVTDECIKRALWKCSKLTALKEDFTSVVDAMPMHQIFSYLPEITVKQDKGRERHPTGRTVLKKLRTKLAEIYGQAIQKSLAEEALESKKLLGCLPFAPLRILQHVVHVLQTQQRLTPDLYDFALIYAFISNVASRKGQKKAQANEARVWTPAACYLSPIDSLRGMNYEELIIHEEGQKRDLELARLGLSHSFPLVIAALDQCLQDKSDDFLSLQAGADWWISIQENANAIEVFSVKLRTEVLHLFKDGTNV